VNFIEGSGCRADVTGDCWLLRPTVIKTKYHLRSVTDRHIACTGKRLVNVIRVHV